MNFLTIMMYVGAIGSTSITLWKRYYQNWNGAELKSFDGITSIICAILAFFGFVAYASDGNIQTAGGDLLLTFCMLFRINFSFRP